MSFPEMSQHGSISERKHRDKQQVVINTEPYTNRNQAAQHTELNPERSAAHRDGRSSMRGK